MTTLTADAIIKLASNIRILPTNVVKRKGNVNVIVGPTKPTPPIETWSSSK